MIAIAVHGVALLGDGFLKPGLAGIAIPFVIDFKPVYVGLGIIGGYLAAALGLSFYARRRIGGKRWRNLHRATPVVYVLGLIHTLGAGTDAGSTWLRAFMLATTVPAVALLVARLRKSKRRATQRREGSERMRIVLIGAGLAAQRCAETLRQRPRRPDRDVRRRAARAVRPPAAVQGLPRGRAAGTPLRPTSWYATTTSSCATSASPASTTSTTTAC